MRTAPKTHCRLPVVPSRSQLFGWLLALAAASPATATIDLNQLASPEWRVYRALEVDGFVISNDSDEGDGLGVWPLQDVRSADRDGASILVHRAHSNTLIERSDDALFEVVSIDFADGQALGRSLELEFVYTDAQGGQRVEVAQLERGARSTTLFFSTGAIRRMSWRVLSPDHGWCQVDNLQLRLTAAP